MRTFALVAEGMTDVAVIERIVEGALGEEVAINHLMPLRDATDLARAEPNTFSSWELVFEYASSEEVTVALSTNDYLIIHIDTDQGSHPNFGLKLLDQNGRARPINEIVHDCRALIISRLPRSLPKEWMNRIIFAIPVLSTECWLLPLFDTKHAHTPKTINNCEGRLAKLIRRSVQKDYRFYAEKSKSLSRTRSLNDASNRTACLKLFVDSIRSI